MAASQQAAMPSPTRGPDIPGGGTGSKSGPSLQAPNVAPQQQSQQQQLGSGGTGGGGSNAVETAIDFWSNTFNLEARKVALDQQGLALSEAKEATQRARKKLAECTRDFKKKSESEKLSSFDELLKSYQEEIDNLTRRARASDAAFHSLYKDLYGAPDPAPLLSWLQGERSRCSTLELELGRLAREVQEYEAEFLKLRNQDVTIRKLEAKLSDYEVSMEAQVEEELEKARAELEELADARVREALDREQRMEDKAKAAEAARDEAQASRQRAQTLLLEATRQAEERAAAAQAEYDLLAETAERHQQDAAAARREADALQHKLQHMQQQDNGSSSQHEASSGSNPPAQQQQSVAELEREKGELTAALGALRQRLMGKEEEWGRSAGQWEEEKGRLQQELERERADKAALQAEMAARPSKDEVEELRARVRLLQQLEYNVLPTGDEDGDDQDDNQEGGRSGSSSSRRRTKKEEEGQRVAADDGTSAAANPEETGGGSGLQQSMEQLLLGRIRRLETEVMAGRRKAAEAAADKAKLAESLQGSEARVSELQALVGRLEEDLSSLGSTTTQPPTTTKPAAAGPPHQQQQLGRSTRGAGLSSLPLDGGASTLKAPLAVPSSSESSSSEQAAEVDMTELLASTTTSSRGRSQHAPSVDLGSSSSVSVSVQGPSLSSSSSVMMGGEGPVDLTKILQAQRDRYRERLRLVEAENEALLRDAARAKAAMEGLQRDNVQLYEKIRFLQTCYSKTNAPQLSSSAHPTQHAMHFRASAAHHQHDMGLLEDGGQHLSSSGGLGGEARYRALYEEQMNPFSQFSASERARRYTELSVAEKITLGTTRFFLQNKAARSFVFFYALGLHALVFLTVFLWSAHHCDDLKRTVPLDHHHHPASFMAAAAMPPPAPPSSSAMEVAAALTGRRR